MILSWFGTFPIWENIERRQAEKAKHKRRVGRAWHFFSSEVWPQSLNDVNHTTFTSLRGFLPFDPTGFFYKSQNNIGCASTPNTTIRFTLYATTICKIVMSRHIWRHFSLCSKPFEGSVFQWYWFRLRHGAASALKLDLNSRLYYMLLPQIAPCLRT